MNGIQATKVGQLAVGQRIDVEVRIGELRDEQIEIKFVDRFSTDTYTLDRNGEIVEEDMGYRA